MIPLRMDSIRYGLLRTLRLGLAHPESLPRIRVPFWRDEPTQSNYSIIHASVLCEGKSRCQPESSTDGPAQLSNGAACHAGSCC